MTILKKTPALDNVRLCCQVLDEKKAEAVKVFDVGAQSSITDYLILATATSEPHLRALRVELEKALDASGSKIVGIEMAQASGWVVIDVFDVMIHLFLGPVREHYNLERLWSDAAEVPVSKLVGAAPAKKAAARRSGGAPRKTKAGVAAKKRSARKSST